MTNFSRLFFIVFNYKNLKSFNLLRNIGALIPKSLPLHKGAFFMFIYKLSIFLTSTAFVATNTKHGISLSR